MPDRIHKAIATTAALERIVAVLQEHYADELAAVAAIQGSPSIDAPLAQHYYLPGGYPDQQLYHGAVAVRVEQFERSSVDVMESGDGEVSGEVVLLPVRVQLMFQRDAYTPLDRIGHDQTHAEALGHLARVYYGALLNTLYKRARDGWAISNLRHTGGDHSVADVRNQLRAGCHVELLLTQSVAVPMAIYT